MEHSSQEHHNALNGSNGFPDDVLQIRAPAVNFYVIRDASGLYLLDAGFIGSPKLLRRTLQQHGWQHEPVRGIIVTHGHLDHILNVASIARESNAWIAAPRLDSSHYAGHPRYAGLSRVTGCLESLGRSFLSFESFVPDRLLDDGDFIDVWQGLRTVNLPGHTEGHSGFYCERLRIMFTSDLFASYVGLTHFPPNIFNANPSQILQSARLALSFELEGVIPNHCDHATPEKHLQRLRSLVKRY